MAFDLIFKDNTFILTLTGSVDLSETSIIKESLVNEPKAGFKKLSIIAESVDYIDSSAVALLLFAKRIAEENQMLFEINSISDAATKVIKLAGLDKVFTLPVNSSSQSEPVQEPEVNIDLNADIDNDNEINLSPVEDLNETADGMDTEEKDEVEMDFNLDFSTEEEEDNAQPVDNTKDSEQNLSNNKDSGDDSKSDDFEFKPGTFE
jgi:anti-sigma B factor antagonist